MATELPPTVVDISALVRQHRATTDDAMPATPDFDAARRYDLEFSVHRCARAMLRELQHVFAGLPLMVASPPAGRVKSSSR